MLFRLFHVVLLYSFQEEQEGFVVWVKASASLHAYVSHHGMRGCVGLGRRGACRSGL